MINYYSLNNNIHQLIQNNRSFKKIDLVLKVQTFQSQW